MNSLLYCFVVALCACSISFTITTTSMFMWLRELISKIHHKLEELIHCPWCLGHYVVLTIMLCTKSTLLNVSDFVIFNFLFTWFTIITLMGFGHYILLRAYAPVAEAMMAREFQKLKKAKKA